MKFLSAHRQYENALGIDARKVQNVNQMPAY